jgi:hypothetical protein
MERSQTENQSAFAQAIKRRDGVMREMLGMGPDPVGTPKDKHHEPQVVIWRVAGDRNRTRAGWADAVAISAQRRKAVPWLVLLSSIAKRNRFLSLRLWSRKQF